MSTNFIDTAKVMSKGQITIPKDIRTILGVENGDRVTFIVEGSNVRLVTLLNMQSKLFKKARKGSRKSVITIR